MKKIMLEAHKMTREMVEKYGVDYQAQLGLNLSYLIENKEEKGMEFNLKVKNESDFNEDGQELVLIEGRKGQWLAIIKDFDDKYGYKRDFQEKDTVVQHFIGYFLKEGNIYNWFDGKKQSFGIVENGILYNISKEDVNNLLSK